MRIPTLLAAIAIAALSFTDTAHAEEYWAACSGCGASTQSFALGVPGNTRGSHIVNVYDDSRGDLRSFYVFIYYDYEFRAWSRFARQQAPSTDALATLQEVEAALAFMRGLSEVVDPIDIDIPNVQDYLLARGALDSQVATRLLNGLHAQGFLERLMNSATLLASKAGRVIASRDVEATFRVTFEDGSSMLVTAEFIANDLNNPAINYVEDSARLPDGTLLPDSNVDINTLLVASNDRGTIEAMRDWVRLFGPRNFIDRTSLRAGVSYRYVFSCDEDECVLTAQEVR